MLSITQLSIAFLISLGLGGWWVARSLSCDDLGKQIKLILEEVDVALTYWSGKLADPTVSAYAQNVLLHLNLERHEALEMRTSLDSGERLTVKQLIRLDKLVSKHLASFVTLALVHPGR
jgi:hypothetical protein